MRTRILITFPTAWDERQLAALPPEVRERHEILLDEPRDDDVPWDLDVLAHVDERVRSLRGRIDGVFSSSDYPGVVAAAAIARALGLPGPSLESVLTTGHKYRARLAERAAVPEAIPRFRLFDPSAEKTWPSAAEFPCFVKPVRGAFSMFARRLEDRAALQVFASSPALAEYREYFVRLFETLTAHYAPFEESARMFLAEEVLEGTQVTVEGWIHGGRARVLGIVDTSFHPGTGSFASFDYPSHLSAAVQARLGRVACRAAEALGLDRTLFNAELFHDPVRDRIGLIEVNPRLCGQFADLYAKVDGSHSYALALELAAGREPEARRGAGRFAAAASAPLRIFSSMRVRRAPGVEERRAFEACHPGALLWSETRNGDVLRVGPEVEDGSSLRYGVINLGGASRSDIQERLAVLVRELGFEFEALESTELVCKRSRRQ